MPALIGARRALLSSGRRSDPIASLFAGGTKGFWFDFSRVDTLFQDTSASTPVASDADPVGRVNDLSGNAINGTQGTSGFRPAYDTSTGRGRLEFDLSDDRIAATFAQAISGDVAYTGPLGTWVDEAVSVAGGGTFTLGPTDGVKTSQIVRALGSALSEAVFLGRTLTLQERRNIGARGAGYLERETAERVYNGTFDTDYAGWTIDNNATPSVSSGVLSISAGAGNGGIYQVIPVTSGVPHILALPTITNGSVFLYNAGSLTNLFSGFPLNASSTRPVLFTPSGSSVTLRLFVLNGQVGTFDNLSIKRLRRLPPAMPWANLTANALGDSLTAQNTWQPVSAVTHGYYNFNFGTGGSRLSGSAAESMWQDARIGALSSAARLVTVMGGTNDWVQAMAVGTLDSVDTDTVYGALNTIDAKLATQCPNARVVYVTPPYSQMLDYASRGWANSETNSIGMTISDYAAAIVLWATSKGKTVIDVNTRCGINSGNIATYMTNDGNLIHPNAAGGQLIGAVVSADIGNLSPA